MNFVKMQAFVQDRLLEGYSNQDTLSLSLIKRSINTALQLFSIETEFLKKTVTPAINIVAGTDTYALASDAIKPFRIKIKQPDGTYKIIEQRDYEEVEDNKQFWQTSELAYYWYEKAESTTKSISLFPIPTANIVAGLSIVYIYLHPELTLDITESDFANEDMEAPLFYACFLVANADGDSPALANQFFSLYNQKMQLFRQKKRQRQSVLTWRSHSLINKRNYAENY